MGGNLDGQYPGDGPLGDRSLPRKSLGYIRVAEKSTSPEHLRGGAISPKAPCRRAWNAPGTDRSEIGPYLGSHWAASGSPKNPPHPSTSEVGRFLRKRHVGGHDKERHSPYPIPQGRTARRYVTLHGRQSRRAVPQGRTARRSVPTSEVIGLHSGRRKIHLTRAPPRWGDFSESAMSAGMERRRDGRLRKLHPLNGLHRIRLQSLDVDDPQGITNSSGDYDSQIHDLARIQR
jgi:hypothetical protein